MHLLWAAMLTRKKKKLKSKSRPRPRPPLLRRPSPLTVPDSIRFVYRQCNNASSGYEWYVVRIPTKQLQFFDQVEPNSYTPHDHHHSCDPTRFRSMDPDKYLSYLGHNPHWICASSPAVVGSHVYSLVGKLKTDERELWTYCLDNKTPPRSLPPPLHCTRKFCTVLSVRGKVYNWHGLDQYSELPAEAFAEVYDPETEQWSYVPQPPDVEILIRAALYSLLIVSLGESEGKVMIYSYDRLNPKFYFYDVDSKKWTVRVTPRSLQIDPSFILNRPIINEDDGNLYWIDRQLCFINVFDWKAMQLFSGPIVGIEHEDAYIYIKKRYSNFSLHHLWGDFFCLNWENHFYVRPFSRSENHFTFLRIVKGPSPGSLSAFVIGCFMDSCYDRSSVEHVICF